MKILSPTLSVGEIKKAACTLCIQAKATLELEVTSLKNNTIKPCKRKSSSLRRSYAMHNENKLPPHLIPLLTMRRIAVIDVDQGLLLANPSHMKRSTMMNADARAQITEDWEMMR